MAVNDGKTLPAQKPGRCQNEAQLQRPLRRRGAKRQMQIARDSGVFPPLRAGQPGLDAKLSQALHQFDALVVGAAASQQRVQMQRAQSRARGGGFDSAHGAEGLRYWSNPRAQRVAFSRIARSSKSSLAGRRSRGAGGCHR